MSMHERHLATQEVLDAKTFEQALNDFRPHAAERNDSFQTKENTRRNSMQHGANLPPSHIHSPLLLVDVPLEPCQRCSGEGNVNKPCGFCKATGKASKTISCVDCHAEKNGCGNMNCDTCLGVGRIVQERSCMSCEGSGSALKLTCGDCGGSGSSSPTSSRSSSEVSCHAIPE
ncbi:hypothetical protein CB0940_05220 [Cercospora beticola]|uniref:Uncharacterized protein n=1 Tax=Cercospora beticola TaxID=122368 RepID=A0A2G5HKR5_CERBT|nr:hypothetical protein CB0940_05220 [Cercospora beticola]PIA93156.1 hypothetical protein CB0940_05220 [Cercospora beticola]WPB02537.1 hypothetical protein RHO25_007173 [Cercospora beticola]